MLSTISDLADRAAQRLLEQYRDSPNLAASLRVFVDQVQEVETAMWALITETSLDTATGIWLDRIGAIVGEAREGAADTDFRAFIRARIVANKSSGLLEELIDVIVAASGGVSPGLTIRELYPAAIELTVGGIVPMADVPRLIRFIRATRAAGVGVMVITQPQADVASFTFATGASPEASTAEGFGDSTNAAVGGQWISAERA